LDATALPEPRPIFFQAVIEIDEYIPAITLYRFKIIDENNYAEEDKK
jgi:hypothetical protein